MFSINIVFNEPRSTGCTGKVIPPEKAYVTIHDSGTSKCSYSSVCMIMMMIFQLSFLRAFF